MNTIYFVSLALVWFAVLDEWSQDMESPWWSVFAMCTLGVIPILNTILAVHIVSVLITECSEASLDRKYLNLIESS